MTIQTLNDGAQLLEQRTKINQNFTELDQRTSTAQAAATAAGQAAAAVSALSIGLGNVDNTSDASKPVSTAQAAAIAAKYTKPGAGIPSSDLTTSVQASLAKADASAPAGTGTSGAIVKADVGLGNVDNTADTAKPVSIAQAAAILAGRLLATRRPSFFFFGSSSTARSYDTTNGFAARGYISRFLRRCGGGVGFAGASGVSGEDSVAQLARLPGVLSGLTTPLPTHFVLQVAGNDIINTNDLTNVTLPNIAAMVQLVLNAGMTPVLMSNNTLLGLTADQIIRAACISEYMRTLWRTDGRLRLADVARYTSDTTSATYAPVAGATSTGDNLHPTSIGAYLMGDALYTGVQHDVIGHSRFAAMPNMLYDAVQNPAGNLIANPFLLGSGGTGGAWVTAGSVPTGMTLNRTAGTGTVAITTVARTDGIAGNWKCLTFSMQNGDVYSIFMQPSNTGLPNNTVLYGMSEAMIDTTNAGGNVQRAALRVRNAANTLTMWDGHTITSTGPTDIVEPTRSRAEFLQTPPAAFPTVGAASLSHDLAFSGTGTCVLYIACMGLHAL